jgi:MarR family transcriptional regulator, organic hydroperoxide resistance regulator
MKAKSSNNSAIGAVELMKAKSSNNNAIGAVELWKLLDNARFAIARLRVMELTPFGLTIEQSQILRTLFENNGSLTTKKLMEVTMRQPNSISVLVNRMIKMGLLKRERSKSGRMHGIHLTQNGEDLIKKVTVASLEMPFAVFTAEETQQLSLYLDKLLEQARELLGIPHLPPFLKYLKEKEH